MGGLQNPSFPLRQTLNAVGVDLIQNGVDFTSDEIIAELPALRKPTVSPLYGSDWVALNTVIEEHVVRELIPQLKEHGAEGIVEYPLNKIIQ